MLKKVDAGQKDSGWEYQNDAISEFRMIIVNPSSTCPFVIAYVGTWDDG